MYPYRFRKSNAVASTKKRKGYVYVTRRLSEPHLYKIGFTARKPAKRIYDSYKIYDKCESWYPVFSVHCSVPYNTEKRVHNELKKYRVKNTELFNANLNLIIKSIRKNAPTIFEEINPKNIENEINNIHKLRYGYPALISKEEKIILKKKNQLNIAEQQKRSEEKRNRKRTV